MRVLGFLVAFGAAWLALDRLIGSPTPMPLPALLALGVALAILAAAELVVFRRRPADLPGSLGLGRPTGRALLVAALVGLAVAAVALLAAAALGVTTRLRADWPLVLVGVLLFHGLAEELVWRGFAFGRLREGGSYRRAILLSMPLIALTHLPIVVTAGLAVGLAAMLVAAVTCLPMAHLWERGGRTVWAPAVLHAAVDWWKLLEATSAELSVALAGAALVVPLLALAFGDRFFGRSGAAAGPSLPEPATSA